MVVGAGPAGLTTANLLGIEGVNTLLIERHESTVQEPRAVSIDDEALRTMQAIDLSDNVLADVMQDYGSHYFTAKGKCFAKVVPSTREHGYPRRNAFRQPLLEETLRKGLDRFGSVDTRFSHTLVSFDQNDNGVQLDLELPDGSRTQVFCDYLIGCDGGQSSVRQQLGIELKGSTYRQRWLIVDIEESRDRFRHTRVFCDPRRPGISLPGPGGTRRFEFMLHDGESDDMATDPAFVGALMDRYGKDRDPVIVRRQVYTFHARVAARWRNGRVFLAGDAAHLTPPFAGQGMNSGIRDAHNLGWKLAAVVSGRLPNAVLDSYEKERKPHAWSLIQMAVNMGRIMMPTSPMTARLVQTGLQALRIYPPAQQYVTQMKFKPKPCFNEGFLCAPGNASEKELIGNLFPQPRLELAGGEIKRLDEILGRGFSLVLIGESGESGELPNPVTDSSQKSRVPFRLLRITPSSTMPVAESPVECARDIDNALNWVFENFEGSALLLRPDHYVAAVVSLEELSGSQNVDTLLEEMTSGA